MIIINNISETPATDTLYSELLACVNGHGSIPEIEPRTFSFNTPKGACPDCQGLGFKLEFDPELVVPNPELSLSQGAVSGNGWNFEDTSSWGYGIMRGISEAFGFSMDTPWKDLKPEHQQLVLYGTKGQKVRIRYANSRGDFRDYSTAFEGILNNLARRYRETGSEGMREMFEQFMAKVPCQTCKGRRLRPEALAVSVAECSIYDVTLLPNLRTAGLGRLTARQEW